MARPDGSSPGAVFRYGDTELRYDEMIYYLDMQGKTVIGDDDDGHVIWKGM